MQDLGLWKIFDFHENESVVEHIFIIGFAQRLVLTQRQEPTRKCPVTIVFVQQQEEWTPWDCDN